MARCLIVNADDFGFSSGVNRGIVEAHVRGIVTSATVMVNMPGFAEAAELARLHPGLGVGLHFNVTQGRPTAPAAEVAGLLDGRGEFLGTSGAVARRLLTGQATRGEIARELAAQIERAREHGMGLTHIDSHKHAHALPAVFGVVVEGAARFGIGAVRLHRGPAGFEGAAPKQSLVALALAQLGRVNAVRLSRAGVRAPDALLGVARTGRWTRGWLLDLLARLPAGTSELMCHPGYAEEAPAGAPTRLRESRVDELAILTDPGIAAAVRARGIALRSFADAPGR